LTCYIQGIFHTEASNLGTASKRTIILLHAVHDCPNGRTGAIARRVSFA